MGGEGRAELQRRRKSGMGGENNMIINVIAFVLRVSRGGSNQRLMGY